MRIKNRFRMSTMLNQNRAAKTFQKQNERQRAIKHDATMLTKSKTSRKSRENYEKLVEVKLL